MVDELIRRKGLGAANTTTTTTTTTTGNSENFTATTVDGVHPQRKRLVVVVKRSAKMGYLEHLHTFLEVEFGLLVRLDLKGMFELWEEKRKEKGEQAGLEGFRKELREEVEREAQERMQKVAGVIEKEREK